MSIGRPLTLAFLTVALSVSPALADSPRAFVTKAIQGDNSEIQLGALAASRGASPGVRQFGRTLRRDHTAARVEARQLARRLGVTPPTTMMPEARQEYRRLQRLHGPAFDREFTRYMVEDHRKDIADFREEADKGGPAADLARRTLPTLQSHLDIAQSLSGGR